MVFSKEDKIVIQNDYEDDHLPKNWTYTYVKRLLKRFKDSGTMNSKEGSGQPRSVTPEKNID